MIFNHYRSSSNSSASSVQTVSRSFSPVMHMNLHLVGGNLASSPWISHHHLWWTVVWSSVRVSQVCWIWSRFCSGRSASVVKWFSYPEGFTQVALVRYFSPCNFMDPSVRWEVMRNVLKYSPLVLRVHRSHFQTVPSS